ncbi:MAG: response regulator [Silvanigrellales bacterium]|nr:response regulator [Silvanigrellales bacterium]
MTPLSFFPASRRAAEFRAPTKAVLGWLQVLRACVHEKDKVLQILEILERSATLQMRLIDEHLASGCTNGVAAAKGSRQEEVSEVPVPASQTHPDVSHVASPEGPLRDKRVLVVDDADDVRDLLSFVLARAGAHVCAASSAHEAMRQLCDQTFDVLISDLGMPEEDGYSFILRWRRFEKESGRVPMPALSLTAYSRQEDKVRALWSGFDAHVAKPVTPPDLVARVGDLLKVKSVMI